MLKDLKKGLMIVSVLLILFLVAGSVSASDDVISESSQDGSLEISSLDDANAEEASLNEEMLSDSADGEPLSDSSSSDEISQASSGDNEMISAPSDSVDILSNSSIDSANEASLGSQSASLSSGVADSGNTLSSNKVYTTSTKIYFPTKVDYTSGKINFNVQVYNLYKLSGVSYRDPFYGSKVQVRIYSGSKYKTYSGTIDQLTGFANMKLPKLALGTHKIIVYVDGVKRLTSSFKVVKSATKVLAPSKTVKLKKSAYFYMRVFDSAGYAAKKISLKVKVSVGKKYKTYTVKTNANGLAKMNTRNWVLGSHKVIISTNSKYYKISKSTKVLVSKTVKAAAQSIKASAPSATVKYQQSSYFNITVKNAYDYAVKNLALKVKVWTGKKTKTYTVKTNSKGIAKLQTKSLAVGTHKVSISSGNKKYKLSKTSSIKVAKTIADAALPLTTLHSLYYYQNSNGYNAKIVWNSKKNSQYLVLRKLNGAYSAVAVVKANSTESFFVNKVNAKSLYTYTVSEIVSSNGVKNMGLYDSEGLKMIARPNVDVDFQNLRANVTWTGVADATKYRVYRKMGRSADYGCIATVNSNVMSYIDVYSQSVDVLGSILTSDVFADPSFNTLFYTVRASNSKKANGVTKTSYGLYLPDGDFNLEAPTIVSLKNNAITWGKVPNADGYIVFKKNSLYDAWEEIGRAAQKTSTTISMALSTIDRNAYYTVMAYAAKNDDIVYSRYDEGFTLKNFKESNSQYNILYFGDSITYGSPYKSNASRHIFSYANRVAELLGCNFYNPSIPGSTYHDLGQKADGTNVENTNYYRYRICREVVDQIANGQLPGNWYDLDTSKNSQGQSNTYIYDYNIVVLAAGTNDYLDNSVLGDINSTNVSTFNGAFNHIMEQILNASKYRMEHGEEPIKVVFVDLFYSDRTNDNTKRVNRDVTKNKIGLTLMDYQQALWDMYEKWQNQTVGNLTFYNFKTRSYNIVTQENCPYTSSDNLHFTKFTYGQYGNAFAQFLVDEVF